MYHRIGSIEVNEREVDWELYANRNLDKGVYATQRGLGKIVGRNEATIRNWRRIKDISPITGVVNTTKGLREVSLYDQNEIYAALAEYQPSDMEFFVKFLHDGDYDQIDSKLILATMSGKIRDKKKLLEKEIELELAKNTICYTQVETMFGRIDVLTENEVIEIKTISEWKHAIGQVLVYCLEFPDKKPHVYLFGETSDYLRKQIKDAAARLGVKVSYREEQEFS